MLYTAQIFSNLPVNISYNFGHLEIQVIDQGLKKHIEIIQGLDSGYDFAKNSTSSLYDRTVPHLTVL